MIGGSKGDNRSSSDIAIYRSIGETVLSTSWTTQSAIIVRYNFYVGDEEGLEKEEGGERNMRLVKYINHFRSRDCRYGEYVYL